MARALHEKRYLACLVLCVACTTSQDSPPSGGENASEAGAINGGGTGGANNQATDGGPASGGGRDDGNAGYREWPAARTALRSSRLEGSRQCVPAGQVFGDPLAAHPTPTLVQNGIGFLEGPVWLTARSLLYYSNFEGTGNAGRIRTYDPKTGTLAVFIEGIGTNGLAVDGDGMIIAGFHEMQRVLRVNPETAARSDVLGATLS